jgi:hypothetical protein
MLADGYLVPALNDQQQFVGRVSETELKGKFGNIESLTLTINGSA